MEIAIRNSGVEFFILNIQNDYNFLIVNHCLIMMVSCRMSSEMVACIAVESLSILEKMHAKGYDVLLHWIFPLLKIGLV